MQVQTLMRIGPESVRSQPSGKGVVPLRPDWCPLLNALSSLGPVTCRCRNRQACMEAARVELDFQQFGSRALAFNEHADVRVSLPLWNAVYAVARRPDDAGPLERSLHFFTTDGAPVQEIVLTRDSSIEGFEQILEDFAAGPPPHFANRDSRRPMLFPAVRVDRSELLSEWAQLTDTLSFAAMLRRYKLPRQEAFRLAEGRFTRRVQVASLRQVLACICAGGLDVSLTVANAGCAQTYRGRFRRCEVSNAAIETSSRKVSLTLYESGIATVWAVETPTKAGPLRSLEALDFAGNVVLSITGARASCLRQEPAWHHALADLPASA